MYGKSINAIDKYIDFLNTVEIMCLRTLDENKLLLELKLNIDDIGKMYLIGYNLQRQIIFKKYLN